MKRIRNAFVTGLLVLFPIVATFHILIWLLSIVDKAIPFWPDTPGLGILMIVILIIIIGALTQVYAGKWFLSKLDLMFRKFPVVGSLYSAIKKFVETLFSSKADNFREAVLVEFPRPGIKSIGFLTGDPDPKIKDKNNRKLLNVFVPCTPNPTAGFYIIVPEDEVEHLDMTVQQAFKIVISMGVISSEPSKK